MSASRRAFLLLPALGVLPGVTQSGLVPPLAIPVTRILLAGDVMLDLGGCGHDDLSLEAAQSERCCDWR